MNNQWDGRDVMADVVNMRALHGLLSCFKALTIFSIMLVYIPPVQNYTSFVFAPSLQMLT